MQFPQVLSGCRWSIVWTCIAACLSIVLAADEAPTIAVPAVATPAVVTAKTAALTVLGADDGGATALTYTWSASGPVAVAFSANGTNAARAATATFKAPGTYVCTATVRDAAGQVAVSSVTVEVSATLTTLSISPTSAVLNPGLSKTFVGMAKNQFGGVMTVPLTWTATGGGTVDASGRFTAGAEPGPASVTVAAGAKTAKATIRVNAAPSIALTPIATPVSGKTAALAAVGADPDDAVSTLKYTWSATGPKKVTVTPNGTNASRTATATFAAIGTYTITVTVKDPAGLSASTAQTVVVQAVPTSAVLSPASAVLLTGQSKTFTMQVRDQFGVATSGGIASATAVGASATGSGTLCTVVAGTGSDPGSLTVDSDTVPAVSATAALSFIPCEGAGTGLAGTYFDNEDFTGATVQRLDPRLAFSLSDWPDGKAIEGIGAEWWSAIWTGFIDIPLSDTYTFKTRSNNGVILKIAGQTLVENWAAHGAETDAATVTLPAGRHPIEVRFYNTHFSACMQLWWSSAAIPEDYVPTCVLYPARPIPASSGGGTGLCATYFDEDQFGGFTSVKLDPRLDLAWDAQASPATSIAPDAWSVRWVGQIEPEFTDTYTFAALTNHPFTLSINAQTVIDDQADGVERTATGKIFLQAGRRYDLVATYRATTAPSRLALSWSCALAGGASGVPTARFYPVDEQQATALQFRTPLASYTSPAWIEGTVGHWTTAISATVDGAPVQVARAGAAPWYLTSGSGSGSQALGVPLQGDTATLVLTGVNGAATNRVEQTIAWTTIDLAQRPYGLDALDVRPGDSLRLTATGTGTQYEIGLATVDGFVPARTGTPGQVCVLPFTQPGTYAVVARIDGTEVGRLAVRVPHVDLQGPIACHIDYQRIKDIVVQDHGANVMLTANDASLLTVCQQSVTGDARRLTLRPLQSGEPILQTRLGGDGPVIRQCAIDEFTLRTTADTCIRYVGQTANGSQILEAYLHLRPLVKGIDVRLSAYTAGVTFMDSSIEMLLSTDAFLVDDNQDGYLPYRIITAPGAATCHSLEALQGGVRIADH